MTSAKNECPLPANSQVWGYARDSGGDTQDLSVRQQIRAMQEYCDRHGLVLVRVFKDEASPGGSTIGRDAFDDMFRLARQEPRPVSGIIVWSFSRFARNLTDAQFHKAALRRRGYTLVSLTDDLPDGDFAFLMEAIVDWKNAQYLKDLSRDVQRGLRDLALQGYAPGGFPPVGYKARKETIGKRRDGSPHVVSRWIPDPEKVPLVRKAWRMRVNGATYGEIHQATHLYGSKGSYASMFKNETYRGVLKCGDLKIEDGLEAIIDDETWEAVQERRRSYKKRLRSTRNHPKRERSSYLLSGIVICGECGAAMTGGTDNIHRNNPWPYYLCGRKKRKGWHSCPTGKVDGRTLERLVLEVVSTRVLTSDYVMRLANEVNAHLVPDIARIDHEIEAIRRQLNETNSAIENLLDVVEAYGADAAGERLSERERKRDELIEQLSKLEQRRDLHRLQVDPDVIGEILGGMRDVLADDDIQAKRVLLRRFVDRVEVYEESLKVFYVCPVSE